MRILIRLFQQASGATAIEYALIAGIIGTALVAGLGATGNNLEAVFNTISTHVSNPAG
ncbi:pilus assembly protein Flp/PilA [Rhizobium sp. RU20A]|uniref:Flp family type IVb pilin n=1 Tax=Rhizobium sp. RU20A TaxID=1907412 RepID=UPI000953F9C9|nr:Flp family type IVb pilin [Rhizobium sp. RU20A]SIR46249.1 pilus assembly protein Flp/PilA [Rhizobium sp. RU20A]